MRILSEVVERVRCLLGRRREEREMEEELRFHLEMETEANLRRGMSPAEARGVAPLVAYPGSAALVLAVAATATWLPAKRAGRLPPSEALRAG